MCHCAGSCSDSGQERINNKWGDKKGKKQIDSTRQNQDIIPCPAGSRAQESPLQRL